MHLFLEDVTISKFMLFEILVVFQFFWGLPKVNFIHCPYLFCFRGYHDTLFTISCFLRSLWYTIHRGCNDMLKHNQSEPINCSKNSYSLTQSNYIACCILWIGSKSAFHDFCIFRKTLKQKWGKWDENEHIFALLPKVGHPKTLV